MTVPAAAPDLRRARRAFTLVGLAAPALFTATATGVMLAWQPDLPEQVVTHWGPDGPDGFASPSLLVWMQVVLGLALPALMVVPVLATMRRAWGAACRFLGAMSLGISALLAISSVGSVAIQRDSVDVGFGIGAVMITGFAATVVFGLVGWLLQPNTGFSSQTSPEPTSLALAPGERAAWFGTVSVSRAGRLALGFLLMVLVAATVWSALSEAAQSWILVVVTVLVLALMLTTLVFRVHAGADGLRVRSMMGWPAWGIPTDEIADVRAVRVNPMAEFGGWGVRRSVDGRFGVVLRTGDALELTRTNGKVFVVTVDDAATAASVLSASVKELNS